jgi:hypothetical protein
MSLPAVTFTHSGGAARIRWWVEGVRLAGLIPVVAQDRADPLPGTVLGWLHAAEVPVVGTTFPRRGNLNGTDCAIGICETLAAVARLHRSRHVLKLDDDTVVVDPELFTGVEDAAAVGLTWAGDPRCRGGSTYGMAYALRVDVALAVAACLRRLPFDAAAPEDMTIWSAGKALAGPAGVIEYEFDIEAGPFAALPWGSCVRDAVERYGVITVGNPPPGGWKDRPIQTAEPLRQVVCTARAKGLRAGRKSINQSSISASPWCRKRGDFTREFPGNLPPARGLNRGRNRLARAG